MASKTGGQPASPGDLEVVSTRVLNAPRSLVYETFRNPDHLVEWWGPKEFTNTFHEFNLQPGGVWRLTMHGPDGNHYDLTKYFTEVVPPERVVLKHVQPMHNFLMIMKFEDTGGKTTLNWRLLFESSAGNDKLGNIISAANEENFDRLEAYLKRLSSDSRSI